MTGLTTGQLRTLSGEELGVFRPGQIQAISSETIAGLKPAALDDLSRRQVKAFTDAQLAGLSRRQVKNADDFIDALSTEQREALSFSPSSSNRLVDPLGQDELHLLAGLDPLS